MVDVKQRCSHASLDVSHETELQTFVGMDDALVGTEEKKKKKGLKDFDVCFDGPCSGLVLTQRSYMLVTRPRESLSQL